MLTSIKIRYSPTEKLHKSRWPIGMSLPEYVGIPVSTILFLFNNRQVCPLSFFSPQMESMLQEPRLCPLCHGLIARTDPHTYCFKCLSRDHTESGVQQSRAWDHFYHFEMSLHCDVSEPELKVDEVETPASMRPTPPQLLVPLRRWSHLLVKMTT